MKWFLPIRPKKEYISIILLIIYNQFFPILLSFSASAFLQNNNFILGYVLLSFAFFPIFFPLKYEFGEFYFALV